MRCNLTILTGQSSGSGTRTHKIDQIAGLWNRRVVTHLSVQTNHSRNQDFTLEISFEFYCTVPSSALAVPPYPKAPTVVENRFLTYQISVMTTYTMRAKNLKFRAGTDPTSLRYKLSVILLYERNENSPAPI